MNIDKSLESECDSLRNLLKKKGEPLIQFVLSHNKSSRQALRQAYKACFGVDLEQDIDKNLSGHFKQAMIALFQRSAEFDAECLYKAMKGMGTDEDTLIEIICTRGNEQLKVVKAEFDKKYPKQSLESWVQSETSGSFRKLLISLLQCSRSENPDADEKECEKMTVELYEAGEKRRGTDEPIFNKIFATASPAQLYCICQKYNELYKKPLKEAIEKEYSRDVKKAFLTILDAILNPTEYFARKVNKAVKGLGTNDTMLIRVLVSREGIDIGEMRKAYSNIFKKDMVEDIKGDTSGDYQKLLIGIANGF